MASGVTGSAIGAFFSGIYTLALQLDGNLVLYKGLLLCTIPLPVTLLR